MSRNLSPATRQKLAILLKSRAKQQGLSGPANSVSPNLAAPPVMNGLKLPMPPASPAAVLPQSAEHMGQPGKFGLLRKRLKPF